MTRIFDLLQPYIKNFKITPVSSGASLPATPDDKFVSSVNTDYNRFMFAVTKLENEGKFTQAEDLLKARFAKTYDEDLAMNIGSRLIHNQRKQMERKEIEGDLEGAKNKQREALSTFISLLSKIKSIKRRNLVLEAQHRFVTRTPKPDKLTQEEELLKAKFHIVKDDNAVYRIGFALIFTQKRQAKYEMDRGERSAAEQKQEDVAVTFVKLWKKLEADDFKERVAISFQEFFWPIMDSDFLVAVRIAKKLEEEGLEEAFKTLIEPLIPNPEQ